VGGGAGRGWGLSGGNNAAKDFFPPLVAPMSRPTVVISPTLGIRRVLRAARDELTGEILAPAHDQPDTGAHVAGQHADLGRRGWRRRHLGNRRCHKASRYEKGREYETRFRHRFSPGHGESADLVDLSDN